MKFNHFILWCKGWYKFKDCANITNAAIKAFNMDGYYPNQTDVAHYALEALDYIRSEWSMTLNGKAFNWETMSARAFYERFNTNYHDACLRYPDMGHEDRKVLAVVQTVAQIVRWNVLKEMLVEAEPPKYDVEAGIWHPKYVIQNKPTATEEEMNNEWSVLYSLLKVKVKE